MLLVAFEMSNNVLETDKRETTVPTTGPSFPGARLLENKEQGGPGRMYINKEGGGARWEGEMGVAGGGGGVVLGKGGGGAGGRGGRGGRGIYYICCDARSRSPRSQYPKPGQACW